MKINQVAKLTGLTVRTLHFYDEKGLLKPSRTTEAGYRLYDQNDLETLQQIMFFRELDFPLEEIKEIITNPDFDRKEALKNHKNLLIKKRDRLNDLIGFLEDAIDGKEKISFKEFDMKEIEKCRAEYAAEAKERWGGTDAYKESEKKMSSYSKQDMERIAAQGEEIMTEFAAHKEEPADGPAAQELVKKWQDYITQSYYKCTDEILAGLGMMYTGDERFKENIDKHGEGTAEFMSAAIAAYCSK